MIGKHVFGVIVAAVALATGVAAIAASKGPAPVKDAAAYTADGRLLFPTDYRTWVYLSSGVDMAYVEGPGMAGMTVFDNVFVNREAWDAFQKTGTWPDGTVLVLEVRSGVKEGSINRRGHFQAAVMGTEVHVRDSARFKDGWAFFAFDGTGPGQLLPQTAPCYACHKDHAAVDTTFVQFYPTLLPIARQTGTLSAAYLAEEAAAKARP